jgi:hypothetical protein
MAGMVSASSFLVIGNLKLGSCEAEQWGGAPLFVLFVWLGNLERKHREVKPLACA